MKKLGIMDLLDTKGLSDEDVKRFEALDAVLGEAFEKQVKSYLADEVKLDELKKTVEEACKSLEAMEEFKGNALDKEEFDKHMKSINEALVRLKAAAEVGKDGALKVKSISAQLEEQLKDYISVDKKGNKTLNLKDACMKSQCGKMVLDLVVARKDAATIASGTLAPHYGVGIDPVLSVDPRRESVIRKYANVASTGVRSLIYAEYKSKEGDAAWTQEGALKPLMDATLEEHTISAGKVAIAAKFTEETLTDFPSFVAEVEAEMVNKLGLKEESGILDGSGSSGEIKGVATDMPAYSLDNLEVEKPNMFDALVAAYTQIVSTSEMSYRPNLVLMHPLDYAAMQLTKDVNGQYLRPFRSGDELVQGLSVETTTAVKQGDFIMGDFNYLNIRDVWGLSMSIGWENDDFRKNIVTVLAEKRLMAYIKAQYKTAFVKDSFATVIEGITPAGVGG